MASFDGAIPPGQAGKITASVRTEHLKGSVAKGIEVTTNDPVRPSLYLTVRATVVGSVQIMPMPRLLIYFGGEQAAPARVIVRKDPGETGTLAVTDLSTSVPYITATARKVEAPEPQEGTLPPAIPDDYVIEVKVTGDPPTGNMNESLKLHTGLEREPIVSIPVFVQVRPALSISTSDLVLPSPTGSEETSGIVLMSVRPDLDPASLVAKAAPEPFHAELEPAGPRHFKLHVGWHRTDEGTSRNGTVTLQVGKQTMSLQVRVGAVSPPAAPTEVKPGAAAQGPS